MSGAAKGFLPLAGCGFTLFEIVVALAIFSILAAIAIPEWGTLLPTFEQEFLLAAPGESFKIPARPSASHFSMAKRSRGSKRV